MTIAEVVAKVNGEGHNATAHMIRDWTERGLLDYPQRRSAGRGRGSKPALYSAQQVDLLLLLLRKREEDGRMWSLARIPVAIWIYWGSSFVSLANARRSFLLWLGDARDSKKRSEEAAQRVLGVIDNPLAEDASRTRLLNVIAEISYTGRADLRLLRESIDDVFDPGNPVIKRAIGHPEAPITAEAMFNSVATRLRAVTGFRNGRVTDEVFAAARALHLESRADYVRQLEELQSMAPANIQYLFGSRTLDVDVPDSCSDLMMAIGLVLGNDQLYDRFRLQAQVAVAREKAQD